MIDWFTVIAQIINFLILVGLLKYFLYGRIVTAMEKRASDVAARWQAADQHVHDTEQELNSARLKNRELDSQREVLLGQARDEVELYRQEGTAKVREDLEQQRARWADAIRNETDAFLQDLGKRASQEIYDIARLVLRDLAGQELEHCIIDSFLNRLEHLDAQAETRLTQTVAEGKRHAVIETAFDLSNDDRQRICDVLRDRWGDDLEIRFDVSRDLACGIALHTNAHKLAWELNDYLVRMEQEMQNAIEEATSARRVEPVEGAAV